MRFLTVAGSAFHPRNSTYTYAEAGNGDCIYQTAGSANGIFVADLQLPQGAVIDILRLFYYDTSSSNSFAWLTEYSAGAVYSDVAHTTSLDALGYGNYADTSFSYTVDDYTHSLVLNWRSNQLGSTIQLCAMRIRYWTTAPCCSFLPLTTKQ
jgi:hypothetical protein